MGKYLKGLPELQKKLDRLKAGTEPAIKAAMAQAADKIVAAMKRMAPVDEGDLRNSIGWSWGDAPKGSLAVATARSGSIRMTIYAGSETAYYARWVEFGTAPHTNAGQMAGSVNPGMAAQPFFFPAYRANRKQAKALVRKAIKTAVKEAVQ